MYRNNYCHKGIQCLRTVYDSLTIKIGRDLVVGWIGRLLKNPFSGRLDKTLEKVMTLREWSGVDLNRGF